MQYTVLNPRGIPSGTHILRTESKMWFEGDTLTTPSQMAENEARMYESRGFLAVKESK